MKESRDAAQALAQLGGLGLQVALGTAFFAAVGGWFDRQLGSAPWLLASGCLLGAGLSLYKALRDVQQYSAEQERRDVGQ